MNVKLIFKISNGGEKSRWLVEYGDKMKKSVLLSNEKKLSCGDEIDVSESELCSNIYEEKYNRYLSSTQNIISHLVKYGKMRNLERNGVWNGKVYEHVLQNEKDNLLFNYGYKDALNNIYDEQKNAGNIHKGFANLNSSQAFAFNFFAPLIDESKTSCFLFAKILHENFLELPRNCIFEKVLPEDNTQLDFYCEIGTKKFTFEVKYSENAFGDAEKNEKHQIKYNNYYKEKLNQIILSYNPIEFEDKFYEEYQLWRNLCCLCDENTTVCFVFHKYRTDLGGKIKMAKELLKSDSLRDRVKIIKVDDFIEDVLKIGTEQQKKYYSEFKEKYLELER